MSRLNELKVASQTLLTQPNKCNNTRPSKQADISCSSNSKKCCSASVMQPFISQSSHQRLKVSPGFTPVQPLARSLFLFLFKFIPSASSRVSSPLSRCRQGLLSLCCLLAWLMSRLWCPEAKAPEIAV